MSVSTTENEAQLSMLQANPTATLVRKVMQACIKDVGQGICKHHGEPEEGILVTWTNGKAIVQ